MSTLQEWAHYYVNRTPLRVFPLVPGTKEPFKGSHGFKDATRDHAKIDELWRRPDCNIGCATGDGILVIDLDCKNADEDGEGTLRELQRDAGKIPEETWTAITASGGSHIYFKTSQYVGLDNHTLYSDIDIHGDGAYVILPPSRLKDGREYIWEAGFAPWECGLADANDAVNKLFIEPLSEKNKGKDGKRERFHLPDVIGEGLRSDTLCRAACSMRGTGFPDEVIDTAIRELNRVSCSPPLSENEVTKIIESSLKYGKGGELEKWLKNGNLVRLETLEELKKKYSMS